MSSGSQVNAIKKCPPVAEDGLTILFDNTSASAKNVDLVFVHGLNGHPSKTWSHPQSGFYWPWELHPHLTHSRVMTFGYNADVNSKIAENFIRIKTVAGKLLNALANERISDEARELNGPIVFVGHSLGGLVSKMAAVQASDFMAAQANDLDKIYLAIRAFVLFGVPHGGSAALGKKRVWVLEKMAKAAFTEIPPKLRSALEANSDELLDLADGFRLISLCVENKLIVASFFELLATPGLGERVVDEFSSFMAYAKANPAEPINADHIGMVKFADQQDSKFSNVRKQLQRIERKLVAPESGRDLNKDIDLVFPNSKGGSSAQNLTNLNTLQDIYNVPFSNLKVGDYVTLVSRLQSLLQIDPTTNQASGVSSLNLPALTIDTGFSSDGGGIRTLSSLLVLKEILEAFGREIGQQTAPKPCDCFDMIGGSSVGGLVAILLGIYELSVDEAIDILTDAMPCIFHRAKPFAKFRTIVGQTRFSSSNFAGVLKSVEKRATGSSNAMLFSRRATQEEKCITCVTLIESQSSRPFLLSTYGSSSSNDLIPVGATVQEVAVASVAAPTFFDPQLIGGRYFFDGSLGANNPTLLMLQEAKRLWNVDPDELGLCLSIGSGRLNRSIDVSKVSSVTSLVNLVSMLADMTTETERTEAIVSGMFQDVPNGRHNPVYFRFTATQGLADVALDEWEALPKVRIATKAYLTTTQTAAMVTKAAEAFDARFMEGFMKQFFAATADEMINAVKQGPSSISRVERYFWRREDKLEHGLADVEAKKMQLENELGRVRKSLDVIQKTARGAGS